MSFSSGTRYATRTDSPAFAACLAKTTDTRLRVTPRAAGRRRPVRTVTLRPAPGAARRMRHDPSRYSPRGARERTAGGWPRALGATHSSFMLVWLVRTIAGASARTASNDGRKRDMGIWRFLSWQRGGVRKRDN